MRHTKKTFSGDEVLLDGNEYYYCIFINCRMVYRGGVGDLVGCTFNNTEWVFSGSAGNTLSFFKKLYVGFGRGGKVLVEQILEGIRGRPSSGFVLEPQMKLDGVTAVNCDKFLDLVVEGGSSKLGPIVDIDNVRAEGCDKVIDLAVVTNSEVHEGGLKTGDTYKIEGQKVQVGAFGPYAHAHDMTFTQIGSQIEKSVDLIQLADELAKLRQAMKKEATEAEHDIAVGEVTKAEQAAKKKDAPKVAEYLKSAGKWALDIAAKIGVPLAIEALKQATGIK